MRFSAEEIIQILQPQVLQRGVAGLCSGIATDSRTLQKGELFFALHGPHFDGHHFCEKGLQQGAWGVVAETQSVKNKMPQAPGWIFGVTNTLMALGDVAKSWRRRMPLPVAAVTGSNGKTTTKEMLAAILGVRWNVLKTEGNFNNLIGLPLTLNRLEPTHQAAVFELGMNAPGEIYRLTEIANPQVGVITNASAAHLEKLHTVEQVAKAKGELFEAMQSSGTAVFNFEDPWVRPLGEKYPGRKISFGMQQKADVRFEHMESGRLDRMELRFTIGSERLRVLLPVAGLHNVMNAMAAAAAATALGFGAAEIESGLNRFQPLHMRFEQVQLANGVRLVNDTYNANPLSMEAAFRTVGAARRTGRFVAVLGDMKELGDHADLLHVEIGKKAVQNGIDRLLVVGDFASFVAQGAVDAGLSDSQVSVFSDTQILIDQLIEEVRTGDVVLVKASRAMKLETVVEALKYKFGT